MADRQVVLITGSGAGIGRFLAEHYLERDWLVVGCSRSASDLNHDGYRHFELDVADEPAVKSMFTDVRRTLGRLDVLINNAGVSSMNHVLLTPLATADTILRTNVLGTFLLCREAARLMSRAGTGRIVNLTSVAVPLKLEGEAVYAASKAAVISLTEILARELAGFNITVNAVGPAPIMTGLLRGVPEPALAKLLDRLPIRSLGQMADVANVADFLISPHSGAVTGQTIFLGGA